jgi:hypothetical protein
MTIGLGLAANPRIGNEAGWLLTFDREGGPARPEGYPSIGSDRFYAEINASLPSGLEGGVYSFVIEALPDDLYARINRTRKDAPNLVRLFLFWHEALTGVTGHLRNLAGLTGSSTALRAEDVPHGPVAVLTIVGISRKAGPRHYETTITARERPFEGLARVPLCGKGIEADTSENALDRLRERVPALREVRFRGLEPSQDPDRPPPAPPPEGKPTVELEGGRPLGDLLATLAASMEKQANRHGRGMMLIRDGTLHLGTRPIPFDGGQPVPLSLATGLVEVEALEPVPTDPGFDRCRGQAEPPTRRQFKLTLKGRPEFKPGDVVRFALPPTEDTLSPRPRGLLGDLIQAPLLPSLADEDGTKVDLYLNAVKHTLSRYAAFTTVLTGVEVDLTPGQDPWDIHTPVREPEEPEHVTADPIGDAARAIRGLARRVVDVRRFPDVGEVRSATASGTGEPPGQTALVWRGLGPPDGLAHSARRLPIERENPSPFTGVAYTTPFAWGSCGLVLPRYPGTRVLLVHRDGRGDDPVDTGAIWASGHGPANAKAGDWWLILPAEVPEADRAAIPDTKVPEDYTGTATNDLIDADGNRCIEVGRLTVRVGKDGLQAAGTRPAPADADVSIEHADGKTRLVVKADGTIEITAASKLTLTVEDGPIELSASSVDVKVDGAMDVTGR